MDNDNTGGRGFEVLMRIFSSRLFWPGVVVYLMACYSLLAWAFAYILWLLPLKILGSQIYVLACKVLLIYLLLMVCYDWYVNRLNGAKYFFAVVLVFLAFFTAVLKSIILERQEFIKQQKLAEE